MLFARFHCGLVSSFGFARLLRPTFDFEGIADGLIAEDSTRKRDGQRNGVLPPLLKYPMQPRGVARSLATIQKCGNGAGPLLPLLKRAEVAAIGAKAGETYTSKLGYPIKSKILRRSPRLISTASLSPAASRPTSSAATKPPSASSATSTPRANSSPPSVTPRGCFVRQHSPRP